MLARYLLFPLLSFRSVAAWHCWEDEQTRTNGRCLQHGVVLVRLKTRLLLPYIACPRCTLKQTEGRPLPSLGCMHMGLYLLELQCVREVRPRKRVGVSHICAERMRMHIRGSAVAAGDSHVTVTPQNVARTCLADGYHSGSASHLRLALVRQLDAKLTIRPRDQTGAIESIRPLGTPFIGTADT